MSFLKYSIEFHKIQNHSIFIFNTGLRKIEQKQVKGSISLNESKNTELTLMNENDHGRKNIKYPGNF